LNEHGVRPLERSALGGNAVGSTLVLLAVVALGLSAGALVAEGAVLVPFWRSLQPESFLAWYRQHAALLLRFFGPVEIVAAALAVLAALVTWFGDEPGSGLLAISALLAVLVLAAFPLYFQRANARFAEATIAPAEVAAELRRWSNWHWVRAVLAVAAFVVAVVAASPGHRLRFAIASSPTDAFGVCEDRSARPSAGPSGSPLLTAR